MHAHFCKQPEHRSVLRSLAEPLRSPRRGIVGGSSLRVCSLRPPLFGAARSIVRRQPFRARPPGFAQNCWRQSCFAHQAGSRCSFFRSSRRSLGSLLKDLEGARVALPSRVPLRSWSFASLPRHPITFGTPGPNKLASRFVIRWGISQGLGTAP